MDQTQQNSLAPDDALNFTSNSSVIDVARKLLNEAVAKDNLNELAVNIDKNLLGSARCADPYDICHTCETDC